MARLDSLGRRAAKAFVLPLGIFDRAGPGDIVALLYHRVGSGSREIDLDTAPFRRQVEHLAERRVVRSLDDALSAEDGVVLTFDDGFRDFYDNVLPVLVRHGIPATLYLATAFVENGRDFGVAPEERLTWDQLKDAVASGLVTVASHTHSHADLSRATVENAAEEMRRSKELIEDRLGVRCRHFAYPWCVGSSGAHEAARTLFDSAALSWATNRKGRIDRYRLGRTPILRNDGDFFFKAKVRGSLDGEALLYRGLRRGPWRRS